MGIEETYNQIFSNDIPKSETIVFEPLLSRYKKLKTIEWGIFFLFLLGVGVVGYLFIEEIPAFVFFVFIAIYLLAFTVVYLSIYRGFRYKGFAIREKDVHYKTGWITRSIISVPICRIQHVKVEQGVFGKLLNVAKLEVYTAGDSSNDMVIRGISFDMAQEIKALLSEKINEDAND